MAASTVIRPGSGPGGIPFREEWLSEWRFVEGDVYRISDRVREYDPDAALVVSTRNRQLGLARWMPTIRHIIGGRWALAVSFRDPETGDPLTSIDQRVLDRMAALDSWKIRRLATHQRKQEIAWLEREEKAAAQMVEDEMPFAEGFMHARRYDLNAKPFAAIPRGV